tara:strand:- start:118 stop:597 length:480 start_codon:yes stop_codon:yes gene_type:complete
MILSQQTKATLVKTAIEWGLDKIHSFKTLDNMKREDLISMLSAKALTDENLLKQIQSESKPEPVVNSSKVKCAKYTFEFTNGSKATAVFRKEADESWTIMRTSTRLNWMLQPKRTWDREWTADDKTPRTLIKEEPRPWAEIRKFVFNHKHEVETFTIDA